jgi:DNA-binding response OmpR family regulator
VARLAFLTDRSPADALPTLPFPGFDVKVAPLTAGSLSDLSYLGLSAVLVDTASDPAAAFALLLRMQARPPAAAVIAVVAPSDLTRCPWHEVVDDVLLRDAGEDEVRLRLALASRRVGASGATVVRLGPLAIDVETYQVSVAGRVLDLTYKEFELLRFLVQHPGRVFTRSELLRRVWGYDFYGGTRTVDVHVRRLRAKLGPEHEGLVRTVRGVGYRAVEAAAASDD